jgi:Ca2+-binding RTX toxin-like protein
MSSVNFVLEANVENLVLTGSGNVFASGNAGVNALTGNSGNNILNGLGGGDTMTGGAGNDTYVVDEAGDAVVELAGEGVDSVNSHISYVLGTELEYLYLMGTADIDGTGNAADNWMEGNRGANLLDGGTGADNMRGGDGNDTSVVDHSGDKVTEMRAAGGLDTVKSSVSFTLGAHVEQLELTGSGNVNATGNGLANPLTGNGGANVLRGNLGADRLTGGAGNDDFAYSAVADSNAAGGIDRILDFATGDRIDLSGIDAKSATGANDAFSFIGAQGFSKVAGQLRAEDKGAFWQVEADVNGDGAADFVLEVVRTDAQPLTGAGFVF